jgi:hypothetical protein
LGIGISLWQAAKSSGNKEWQAKAIQVLLHSTQRFDLKENEVIDAGMCHGTAGISHIYNRMYHYTGIMDFKLAALYWFDETLKMARYTDGYAGFKCWMGELYGGWINKINIFDGITGIGLAILSAISDLEPNWDQVLLLC